MSCDSHKRRIRRFQLSDTRSKIAAKKTVTVTASLNFYILENAIRPFAVGRKNWLFNGSPRGAKAGALFYSLIETCKANQIEPYGYFVSMLHRIRLCKTDEDYRELLPQFIAF